MNNPKNEILGKPFPRQVESDEIDLFNFFQLLKLQKNTIGLFVLLGLLIGLTSAFLLPRYYEASMTIIPNEEQGLEGGGGNNLALLTGLTGGAGKVNEKEIGLLILQSRTFILAFIKNHNLIEVIYPNKAKNNLPPTEEIYEEFSKLLTVNVTKTSNNIDVLLFWKDAEIAKQLLTFLLKDLNALMKERAKVKGEKSLNYLMVQLSQTKDADVRESFVSMIKKETQKMMLADIREEYLFETIDAPIVPAYPGKPNRILIVILSVLGGFIFGVFAAFYRLTISSNSKLQTDQ
jgi:uncharacterized protein involved in exopolysaccharide biosynthesis